MISLSNITFEKYKRHVETDYELEFTNGYQVAGALVTGGKQTRQISNYFIGDLMEIGEHCQQQGVIRKATKEII